MTEQLPIYNYGKDPFISIKSVCDMTSLSRDTIRRREKEGRFPKRTKISKGRVAWRRSVILQWMDNPNQ